MVKQLLCILVLIAAAGYPAHLYMQPPDFGIAPGQPMGTLERLDAFIQRWDHYRASSSEVSFDLAYDLGSRFEGLKKHDYHWKDLRENGYPRWISVVVDAAGNVQAIGAEFPTQSQTAREPELRNEELMWRLWKEFAGRGPRFARTEDDEGQAIFVDTFDTAQRKGSWKKFYHVPNSERSISDAVWVYRTDGSE